MSIFRPAVDWLFGDLYNDATATKGKDAFIQRMRLDNGSGTPLGTASNPLVTSGSSGGIGAGAQTYHAAVTGYTAYATPTALFSIKGSATKTVAITAIAIAAGSTAAAVTTYYFIKRSTANTGGTPTALTAVPLDSNNDAATAVVQSWAAAPTLGTTVGNLAILTTSSTAIATTAPVPAGFGTAVSGGTNSAATMPIGSMAGSLMQPIILRGAGEVLEINFNGAALPGGYSALFNVQWIEYT